MTPTELQERLHKRAKRWHDELDAYAAAVIRACPKDLAQKAIDEVKKKA